MHADPDVSPVDGGPSPVESLIDAALAEARRYRRDDLVARLSDQGRRLASPTCSVLVVGEFNKGKSSLVNALLNARVCATDADIATAVPTFVRYGERLAAYGRTAEVGGGNGDQPQPLELTDLEQLVTRTDRDRQATTLAAVDVSLPRQLLRDGLVLVDTPGVGGGLSSAHATATLRALASADAVVFVTDASQELTAPELALLRRAKELCPQLVGALTKTDFYPEWRRILDIDRAHLRRAQLDVTLLPLSAPLRQHALRTGDRDMNIESGYPRLTAELRATLELAAAGAGAAAAAAAHSAVNQLVTQLATEHAELTDPESHRTRLAKLTEAKQRADKLRGSGSGWQQALSDRIADLASTVDLDIGVRMRSLRKLAADKLAGADPTKVWLELEPWLYQQTNEALADHFRLIRDQADAVADAVAQQFGEAAWQPRDSADPSADPSADFSADFDAVAAGGVTGWAAELTFASRTSRLELGIAAARGGSVGVVLTHAVGLIIGLSMPVTLPITVLLAGVLARKTWKTAKQAQLRGLRAEADRAIATYLEEVELRARKDSRDAVRKVQQYLRDLFSGHAAELHTAAVRNLEVLIRTERDDEQTRRDRLQHNTAELARMRALADRAHALLGQLLAGDGRSR
jgi:Dynamin family